MSSSKRVIPGALVLALTTFLSCSQTPELREPCQIKGQHALPVLKCARFKFAPASTDIHDPADFRELLDSPGWQGRTGTQWRFPGSAETLWIRFSITNPGSDMERRILLNEFAFSDVLRVYSVQEEALHREDQGLLQPWSRKHFDYRLPAFVLRLQPGENHFLLRMEARSGKLISLKLEDFENPAGREPLAGYLFPPFLTGAVAAFVLSLFIAISLRESIGWLYCIYIVTLVLYLFSWEGYARQYLFPDNGGFAISFLSTSGALAGWAVISLWRALLILPVHAPRINQVMIWIGRGYILAAIYSALPFADFRIVDIAVYILPALFIPMALYSGVFVIRIGFRPALFSLIGFSGFLFCIPFFFYAGMGWIPGSDYTRNPLYAGYLFEFSMFLISVGMRIHLLRDLQQAAGGSRTARNLPEAETSLAEASELEERMGSPIPSRKARAASSRLAHFNITELSLRLDRLMQEEKLFCDEDLSLETLAGYMELRRHQLSELIRTIHNTNFYGYINGLRIQCARDMLIAEPERSILSVALAAGFNSKSTFNAEFRKRTGLTPGQFRQENLTATNSSL